MAARSEEQLYGLAVTAEHRSERRVAQVRFEVGKALLRVHSDYPDLTHEEILDGLLIAAGSQVQHLRRAQAAPMQPEPGKAAPDTEVVEYLSGCPVEVWDGPGMYVCGAGGSGHVCARHGRFTPARRCVDVFGCRRPEGHGGRCNPLAAAEGAGR